MWRAAIAFRALREFKAWEVGVITRSGGRWDGSTVLVEAEDDFKLKGITMAPCIGRHGLGMVLSQKREDANPVKEPRPGRNKEPTGRVDKHGGTRMPRSLGKAGPPKEEA